MNKGNYIILNLLIAGLDAISKFWVAALDELKLSLRRITMPKLSPALLGLTQTGIYDNKCNI